MIDYPREKTCAFTGHRSLSDNVVRALSPLLREKIIELSSQGIRRFIAGGAIGFDMLAAITVYNLKPKLPHDTRLTLALPCERHYAKWNKEDAQTFARLLAHADEVIYVGREYTPKTMKERNAFMIDHSAVCVAYLLPDRDRTGTAQTVRLAQSGGLRIINLATDEDSSPEAIPTLEDVTVADGENLSFL